MDALYSQPASDKSLPIAAQHSYTPPQYGPDKTVFLSLQRLLHILYAYVHTHMCPVLWSRPCASALLRWSPYSGAHSTLRACAQTLYFCGLQIAITSPFATAPPPAADHPEEWLGHGARVSCWRSPAAAGRVAAAVAAAARFHRSASALRPASAPRRAAAGGAPAAAPAAAWAAQRPGWLRSRPGLLPVWQKRRECLKAVWPMRA